MVSGSFGIGRHLVSDQSLRFLGQLLSFYSVHPTCNTIRDIGRLSFLDPEWYRLRFLVFQLDPLGLWVFGFLDLLGSMISTSDKKLAYNVSNERPTSDELSRY
ncbi:unnamed protein product [Rhizophagus irregularis]|nr:unnamed protein product [Rhizophagus irregularis]